MTLLPQQINALCKAYDLGCIKGAAQALHGGLSHYVWQIQTDKKCYILKRLNPTSFYHSSIESYVTTEVIARQFSQQGIPAITGLQQNGLPYFFYDGAYWMVWPYVAGQHIVGKAIQVSHAEKIGTLFADIHACSLTDTAQLSSSTYQLTTQDWQRLKHALKQQGFTWIDTFHQVFDVLLATHEQCLLAQSALSATVISHRDLDPTNVLWQAEQQPVILDWESIGFIDPQVDLMAALLDWSLLHPDAYCTQRRDALLAGYQQHGGLVELTTQHWYGALSAWLMWLAFNLQRRLLQPDAITLDSDIQNTLESLVFVEAKLGFKRFMTASVSY